MPHPKLALVTGATRGIGEAIARELIRRGLAVVLTGRDAPRGTAIARELGERASFHPLDVTDRASIDAVYAHLAERGGLDVLMNNAGASFDGFDADVAQRTLDVNFFGMVALTDRLLPLLSDDARVVMVSSGMGATSCLGSARRREILDPGLDRASLEAFARRFVVDVAEGTHREAGWPSNAYSLSKVLMNAYVRVLAGELANDPRRITVDAACPGWVRTAMGGKHAPLTPAQGARTPVWLALRAPGPVLEAHRSAQTASGGFYRDERPIDW